MKKILLSLSILFVFSSATPAEQTFDTTTVIQCHYGQCQATARSTGNQCRHCVSKAGDLYCWQHR